MITRRELTLVLLTALTTAAIAAFAQSDKKVVMGSQAIDWNSLEAKTTPTGFYRKFFEAPTATLTLLECHATTVNTGASTHPPNTHPQDEVIIVKEGTVEAFVNGDWKRIGPGSVIFNASNAPQAIRNVGETPATYFVVMWHSTLTPKADASKSEPMK